MFKGNTEKVMADAKKIARLWMIKDVSLPVLACKYQCSNITIIKAIRSVIPDNEYQQIRRRHLLKGGRSTRFKKRCTPWNKGIHYQPGGRSVLTRFKKGQLRGNAARKYRPVGTISIRHDKPIRRLQIRKRKTGMPSWGKQRKWIKIKDDGRLQDRWIPYARYVWLQNKGPIPPGYFVAHKDGDQLNDEPDNLIFVNHRQALALQFARDPQLLQRLRIAASKASKARHILYRQKIAFYGPRVIIWECPKCGADYQQRNKPNRCKKCGSDSFERIIRHQKICQRTA